VEKFVSGPREHAYLFPLTGWLRCQGQPELVCIVLHHICKRC